MKKNKIVRKRNLILILEKVFCPVLFVFKIS